MRRPPSTAGRWRPSPASPSPAINLGNLLLQGGDAAQAAEAYRKALETEPNNARVRNNLGIAASAGGPDGRGRRRIQEGDRDRPR